jgi:hypothetical protein
LILLVANDLLDYPSWRIGEDEDAKLYQHLWDRWPGV